MKHAHEDRIGGLQMPRSRGAVSGLLLVVLGAWGALIPFVGPHFNFAYTPDQEWTWTAARGWLEVLPGVATIVGGLLLVASRNRATAMFGGWLAALAGAWFVVGGEVAPLLGVGVVGDPVAVTDRKRALLEVSYFSGLGLLIVFLGAAALARVAVRLARDVQLPLDEPAARRSERSLIPTGSGRYPSAVDEPALPSEALTTPRAGHFAPADVEPRRTGGFRRAFRRTPEHPANAYAAWPHAQR